MKYIWPKLSNSGIVESDVVTSTYDDTSYESSAKVYRFDQRLFTNAWDYSRANMGHWGYLYVPNRCMDGTVDKCHLIVNLHGCGSPYS